MPVINIHHTRKGHSAAELDYIYIGRGSIYGNPFSHLPNSKAAVIVGTREESIALYQDWICGMVTVEGWTPPTPSQILALHGKTLGCYCAPQMCHGDVLLRTAEIQNGYPNGKNRTYDDFLFAIYGAIPKRKPDYTARLSQVINVNH